MRAPGHLRRAGRSESPDDGGTTLVELMVYSLLLVLIMAAAGALLISGLQSERDARDVAQASNESQVAARLFERTLRNAATATVPAVHGGTVIVVKTRIADASGTQWWCRAWHYDAASHELRTTAVPATGTPATVALATTVNSSTWDVALRDVYAPATGQFFTSVAGTGAKMSFEIMTGNDSTRLSFSASAVPRSQGTTIGGASCL